MTDTEFADEIARLCYDRFGKLPTKGKPESGREWTLLAAVVQLSRCSQSGDVKKEVVSMGTGTKCIGKSSMSPNGDILNDSHAEVIARRGCLRYLTLELQRAVRGEESSVFGRADQPGKWKLNPNVSFLFFTSHTPCGDASIIPMTETQCQPCASVPSVQCQPQTEGGAKRKAEETQERVKRPRLEEPAMKKDSAQNQAADAPSNPDTVSDIHRTGAKCVPGGPADPLDPGVGYHSTGLLRVKPGRGEPTTSLSCSDKLARWCTVGFQGALLSHYLQEALYFSTLVVGKCPYSQEALHRALVSRCANVSGLPGGFAVTPPRLLQSSLEFPFSLGPTASRHRSWQSRVAPCSAAISWCRVPDKPLDVTTNGYKQGATKKVLGSAKSRSLLCKLELFQSFLALVSATDPAHLPESLRRPHLKTYLDYKLASVNYQEAWQQLRSQVFPLWPCSDRDLLLFCCPAETQAATSIVHHERKTEKKSEIGGKI